LCVIFVGYFFSVSVLEWLVLTLTISTGLVIETINTAIESTTDAITKDWKEEIRIAKDVSAAAMLTHAVGSIIIAGLIFIPKML
jgi:diacylglycerol kinase